MFLLEDQIFILNVTFCNAHLSVTGPNQILTMNLKLDLLQYYTSIGKFKFQDAW